MSSQVALTVAYQDDTSQETFVYSGETIVAPCELIGEDYQPTTWQLSGTPIKFSATTKPLPDSLGLEERFQTITFMRIYSHKSIDELRFEDYECTNVNQRNENETSSDSPQKTTSPSSRSASSSHYLTSSSYRPSSPIYTRPSSPTYSSFSFATSSSPASSSDTLFKKTQKQFNRQKNSSARSVQPGLSSSALNTSQWSTFGSNDWITTGIEVQMKNSLDCKNLQLAGKKGVVQNVNGNMCTVYLYDERREVNVFVCNVKPEEVAKGDKCKIIDGEYRLWTGTLITIDYPDAILKMVPTQQLKIFPLSHVAKLGSSPVYPIKTPSKKKGADFQAAFAVNLPQTKELHHEQMSVSSTEVSTSLTLTSKRNLAFTSNINFISESDPARVFTAPQTPTAVSEPLSSLSVSEGQQLRDALQESIVKCMQIQTSLYRLVLLKLQAHVTPATSKADAYFQSSTSDLPHEASNMGCSGMNLNDAPSAQITARSTARLNNAPNVQGMQSACDIHITSSTESADVNLNDVPKAPSKESTNDITGTFRMESADMSPNDAAKALSIKSMDDTRDTSSAEGIDVSPNDAPAVPSKESPDDIPGTSSMGSADVSLNDAPRASSMDSLHDPPWISSLDNAGAILNDTQKDSSVENTEKSPNDALGTLLYELEKPLQALTRCTGIQRELFRKLITVNLITSKEATDFSELNTEGQVNILAVQSKLEGIAFKTKMECNHARNPFTDHQPKPSTSKDVVQNISSDKCSSSDGTDGGSRSLRDLPHGHGKLETVTGEVVYSGDWCKGKRHGKGECLILGLPVGNNATAEHGFYIGGWKNNMRHGSGKMIFFSGAVYEGQWQFDKMTGYGNLKLPDGTIQEGTWKEGSLQGCALFTWPDGVTEYREFDTNRAQLSFRTIEKEAAEHLSQMSSIRSQLLNLRECVTELKDEKLRLTEQLNAQKLEHDKMVGKVHTTFFEIRESFKEKWERESQAQLEELDKAADQVAEIKKELEEARGGLLCQICFEQQRDCIILPCSHLLYCRKCVAEHKSKGDPRCPTCRGPINSEILCNINHLS